MDIFESSARMSTVSTLSEAHFACASVFVYSERDDQDRENVAYWRTRSIEDQKGRYLAVTASNGDYLTFRGPNSNTLEVNTKDIQALRKIFDLEIRRCRRHLWHRAQLLGRMPARTERLR